MFVIARCCDLHVCVVHAQKVDFNYKSTRLLKVNFTKCNITLWLDV